MKKLACEMCGATDVVKQDGLFVCQNCGTKYSVEEAKKIMIDGVVNVSGSIVKIDNSSELENLYLIARRFKTENNSENAQKFYDMLLIRDPLSWEANFYASYFQVINCKNGDLGIFVKRLKNCEVTVLNLIKENVSDEDERRRVLDEVSEKLMVISKSMFDVATGLY